MSLVSVIESQEPPLALNGGSGADNSQFLVHSTLEIVRILRGLAQHHEMVSAFFNAGQELLLTSVLDVRPNENAVILDCGSNEVLNQRILAAEKIIFVTALDRVKIQFVSNGIKSAVFERGDAFLIPLPGQVLQLQRREYYRMTTPIVNPVKCVLPLEEGKTAELPLVNISVGGIGMMLGNPPAVELEVGVVYPGCRISLPGVGVLEMTLRVQNVLEITLKNGNKVYRAGCQFINLHQTMQSLVQRYIIKLERERIAGRQGH
jgi:c-di-GMP-binding flagellar brake protein YcgR